MGRGDEKGIGDFPPVDGTVGVALHIVAGSAEGLVALPGAAALLQFQFPQIQEDESLE
jgi:hypothetical protein